MHKRLTIMMYPTAWQVWPIYEQRWGSSLTPGWSIRLLFLEVLWNT